ncbi:probable lysosomal cobalamin transporter isoform X2 [Hydra vulgaris]|uniref:Probable lysosomal cobalamin transporter isoform X2 n=1 Tax=Hydra vulgaris TaxID=6087 RepID=A0ABM4D1Y1_HYDVU
MTIPNIFIAGGWIPFVVVMLLTFFFATIYIRWFQHSQVSEFSSTLTSVSGLVVTLMTSALVPVDVFLISYMKNADGSFKEWAADNLTQNSIEDTISYCYYGLYGLVALFVFVILPFMYFFYEEKDDSVTTKERCCTALKYSMVFLLAAFVILLTGAFVPLKPLPSNMTAFDEKFNFLKHELENYKNIKQTMSILVGVISMFGMLMLIQYVAFGMSALPLGMIRCGKIYREEPESRQKLTRKEKDKEKANMLRAKIKAKVSLTRFERNEMRRIEQDELLQNRIDRKKTTMEKGIFHKFLQILKPFQVLFGVFFLFISLLIMISLTITSIDKALHSLGLKSGYALPKPTFPNPVNIVMVYTQQVFPLDYLLFTGVILFFVFGCMNGIKKIGIWCCCIKMFKIRPGRTMPQALIFMVFILMLMIVSLNILLLTAIPQYMQFGNQKYLLYSQNSTNSSRHNETDIKPQTYLCSTNAPEGHCIMSRLAIILNTLFYKAWFFGAFYYWSIWLFIGVYYIGLIYNVVAMFRKKTIAEILSSDEDSEEDMHRLLTA